MKTQIKKEETLTPVTLSVTFENDKEFELFKKFLGKTNQDSIQEFLNCNNIDAYQVHRILYNMYSCLYDYKNKKI